MSATVAVGRPAPGDLVRAACMAGWKVVHSQQGWTHAVPDGAVLPDRGWKLHVTATVADAVATLARCLPVLTQHRVEFKVADTALLSRLNDGTEGLGQIGKFLTVYAGAADRARLLAADLDAATDGCRGPLPPSDRPWRPAGVVSFRFGGFRSGFAQSAVGRVEPVVMGVDGELRPDPREPEYLPPPDEPDLLPPATEALVGGRFLPLGRLARSARGTVHEAIDLCDARACVIKHGPRDRLRDSDGRDVTDRLAQEWAVLADLATDPRFPTPIALVDDVSGRWLVEERMEGERLDAVLVHQAVRGERSDPATVARWAGQLLAMLRDLEDRGWIYGDLTTGNLLVGSDGDLRLVDFEVVARAGEPVALLRGTAGYLAPCGGRCAAHADPRVHAVGAVLYAMLTGAEPSRAPQGPLLRRPVEALAEVPDALVALVERCLTCRADGSAATLPGLVALLAGATGTARRPARSDRLSAQRLADIAHRIGDAVCALAQPAGEGLTWPSPDDPTGTCALRDVNSGDAGVVLALAELVRAHGDPLHRETLRRGALGLLRPATLLGPSLPGLFVGEAGIGCALLRAGQVLGDRSLVAAALARADAVMVMPHTSPDLFNGSAGRLRFHLALWDATGDTDQLEAAADVAAALAVAADRRSWTIPSGFGTMSGIAHIGYAHGAAGIADALLDARDVTAHRGTAGAAVDSAVAGVVAWLRELAVPVAPRGAIGWARTPDELVATAPMWCHGAAGIAGFLARAAASGDVDLGVGALADRAAAGIVAGSSWSGPWLCHGLAGNLGCLLDVAAATGNPDALAGAHTLAVLLTGWLDELPGGLGCAGDPPGSVHAGLMTGFGGLVLPLLRLAGPAPGPAPLSRAWFASISDGDPR